MCAEVYQSPGENLELTKFNEPSELNVYIVQASKHNIHYSFNLFHFFSLPPSLSLSTQQKFLSKLKLLPGKKHKERHNNAIIMERSSSNQTPNRSVNSVTNIDAFCTLPHRGRAHTVGNGMCVCVRERE